MVTCWRPAYPVNIRLVLSPLRRGGSDPVHQNAPDGAIWRTSRLSSGPVSARIWQRGLHEIHVRAWGPGAAEFIESVPKLLGATDDVATFQPGHPLVADSVRRSPGLRLSHTGAVLESLVPAILEQKVDGGSARRSWAYLVRAYGEPAPGPTPFPLWVVPTVRQWQLVPSWVWHTAGVDPRRAATIMAALKMIETVQAVGAAGGQAALMRIPGVGVWTAAEVAQRVWGDADALSVGDFHLAAFVGWSLVGRKIDDEQMVALLRPWAGQRHRVVRLLQNHPAAVKPKFAPRMTVQDHRAH
ncbi:DNA-3-methyladenine glycosylase 2 family protein [Nakamurella antarctica]|uniref:DNA-3-methyladenine glycosylase 2 family protein n=1 Tax=Nakamurella antarctica TaxID=1902245 RepID=A0A3G8ZQG4_9ACTN|nr:DNA-3-methyladenine glycosylase 2 family protein [Nakamurella antarctica]